MKQINGKNYYICIGYIDEEELKNGVDIKLLKSFYVENVSPTTVYVDTSDDENTILIPLIPVNSIQKKDNEFKFYTIISSSKINFENNKPYVNVVGLFEEYKKDNVEFINNIGFFSTDYKEIFYDKSKSVTICIHVDENKLLGE